MKEFSRAKRKLNDCSNLEEQGMPPLPVGSVLRSRYRITNVLYRSPLTNVYKVDDVHLVGNIWAVKEMKILAVDNYERQKIVAQFHQDFVKMTELSHPNFARVIDFFVEGQNLYIIREFIPAYDIAAIMSRTSGFINEKETLHWGAQLADVLHYLSKKKFPAIFYRELNLANILINTDGNAKIIDLGQAWLFQADAEASKQQNVGSVDYASPEQFDERGIFDQRSLVYSLGALLYHVITRQNPSQNMFKMPQLEQYNPEISKATRSIIRRAMELDPNRRYPTLADMKRDLQNAQKNPDSIEAIVQKPKKEKEKKEPMSIQGKWNYIMAVIILGLLSGILFLVYKLFF